MLFSEIMGALSGSALFASLFFPLLNPGAVRVVLDPVYLPGSAVELPISVHSTGAHSWNLSLDCPYGTTALDPKGGDLCGVTSFSQAQATPQSLLVVATITYHSLHHSHLPITISAYDKQGRFLGTDTQKIFLAPKTSGAPTATLIAIQNDNASQTATKLEIKRGESFALQAETEQISGRKGVDYSATWLIDQKLKDSCTESNKAPTFLLTCNATTTHTTRASFLVTKYGKKYRSNSIELRIY